MSAFGLWCTVCLWFSLPLTPTTSELRLLIERSCRMAGGGRSAVEVLDGLADHRVDQRDRVRSGCDPPDLTRTCPRHLGPTIVQLPLVISAQGAL